jgi:hypothetical protein
MKKILCLVLKNNQVIVSEIRESNYTEIGDPDYIIRNPYLLNQSDHSLYPWLDFTLSIETEIHSDNIIVAVEPKPEILDQYRKLTETTHTTS